MGNETNGWESYKIYVTEELKRQGSKQDDILEGIQNLNTRMSVQESRVKWMAGGISTFTALLISTIAKFVFKG